MLIIEDFKKRVATKVKPEEITNGLRDFYEAEDFNDSIETFVHANVERVIAFRWHCDFAKEKKPTRKMKKSLGELEGWARYYNFKLQKDPQFSVWNDD